jgi:hypothetical protein
MKTLLAFFLLISVAFAGQPSTPEIVDIPATTRKEGDHKFSYTLKQTDKRIMSFVIQRTGFSDPSVIAWIRVALTYPEGVFTCGIKIVGGVFPSPTSSQICTPPSNFTFIRAMAGTITVTDNTPGKTGFLSGSATVTFK